MSFEELRAFLVVVERGSFLAAAMALGVSRTTLRRRVDALEAQAGVALLRRDRKGVVLTDAGRKLVRGGRLMEQEFSALIDSVRDTGRRPAGTLRLLLPVGLPPATMAALLSMFRANWPEVRLRPRFTEAPLQASLLDVDVLVWFGTGEPGRAWETHMLVETSLRLLASRAWLAAHGAPRSVDDLRNSDLLAWCAPGENEPRLVTRAGEMIPVRPALVTTNVDLLHESAHLGLGIAWAPDAGLPPTPGREPLVPVLEGEVNAPMPLNLAVPHTLAKVPRVRVVLDSITPMRALIRPAGAKA